MRVSAPGAAEIDPEVYRPVEFRPWPVSDPYDGLLYWGSVFNAECEWMARQPEVVTFASRYWERTARLPALGHLHMLYNRGCHEPFTQMNTEIVGRFFFRNRLTSNNVCGRVLNPVCMRVRRHTHGGHHWWCAATGNRYCCAAVHAGFQRGALAHGHSQ